MTENDHATDHQAPLSNPERVRGLHTVTDTLLCPLPHYGYIAVAGEEAALFLQGQLTADVRELEQPWSLLSAYCNPQGRLLSFIRLFRSSEQYVLRLPQALVAPILQRLRLFVLRSKVQLNDLSTELQGFGLSGADSPALLAAQHIAPPETAGQMVEHSGCWIIRVHGESPRFEIYGSTHAVHTLLEILRPQTLQGTDSDWQRAEIMAGLPEIYPATQDSFIPQMLNLDALGGVAFNKGCYVGQEIVARTHYLGRLKRRMYRLHCPTMPLPAAGARLNLSELSDGQAQIVRASAAAESGVDLLAVLPIAAIPDSGVLSLQGTEHSYTAYLMPLAYSLPATSERPNSTAIQ